MPEKIVPRHLFGCIILKLMDDAFWHTFNDVLE